VLWEKAALKRKGGFEFSNNNVYNSDDPPLGADNDDESDASYK
jgi:hypothetical protein